MMYWTKLLPSKASLQSSKGFTMIELLVTLAVMGAVMTIVMISIDPARRIAEANDTAMKADLVTLRDGLEAYATANNGHYPVTPTWWCENCTAYAAQGANEWIPELVERGFVKSLPTSPVNGSAGYGGCTAGQAAYIYYSDGDNYKLIAHCMPRTGLNDGAAYKGIPYCAYPATDKDDFTDSSDSATKLKPLVDPARPDYAYAVYSPDFICY